MATLRIRNLDSETTARLRLRAASRQRSMEDEARHVLREALAGGDADGPSLAVAITSRFGASGGIELPIPPRR